MKLFEVYKSYSVLLQEPERPTFYYWGDIELGENQKALKKWESENYQILKERKRLDDEYAFSFFARSNLCGFILQFAYKGIELFSNDGTPPIELETFVKKYKAEKFCVGREIDNLPIGLIIYAGRNQSVHYNNLSNKLNIEIFNKLANWYSPHFKKWFVNSYFDLNNKNLTHYSENIIYKLDWLSYKKYESDLYDILKNAT